MATIGKPLIIESNAQLHKRWCHDHKTSTWDNWNVHVMWPDESSFTLFLALWGVYIWRRPREIYNLKCLAPTVKHEGSMMVWTAISWYRVGAIITFHGLITAREYVNRFSQMHPIIQTLFQNNDAGFQGNSVPIHTAGTVCLVMKVNLSIFPGQHNQQIWTYWTTLVSYRGLAWGADSYQLHL
jgi:hypothetical protein